MMALFDPKPETRSPRERKDNDAVTVKPESFWQHEAVPSNDEQDSGRKGRFGSYVTIDETVATRRDDERAFSLAALGQGRVGHETSSLFKHCTCPWDWCRLHGASAALDRKFEGHLPTGMDSVARKASSLSAPGGRAAAVSIELVTLTPNSKTTEWTRIERLYFASGVVLTKEDAFSRYVGRRMHGRGNNQYSNTGRMVSGQWRHTHTVPADEVLTLWYEDIDCARWREEFTGADSTWRFDKAVV